MIVYFVTATDYGVLYTRYEDVSDLNNILERFEQQDDRAMAVDNHGSAGRLHWLIMPKVAPAARHIRDIEALASDHLPLRIGLSTHLPIQNGLKFGSQETGASQGAPSKD